MRPSSPLRAVLALALALVAGGLAARPAAAFDPSVQVAGWHRHGDGYGYGHWHPHRPPPRVYVPPPRHVHVPPPPPVVYHRPPCWRLPPWHPAFCAPPPRYHRHW
jgi:hypothetical protein